MHFRIFAESINRNSWLIDYANVLVQAGHEVSIHSGLFKKFPSGSLNKKRLINNILIHFKLIRYFTFDCFSGGMRPSYLISSTPVGLIAFAGLLAGSKIRLIAVMMDLYPHSLWVNLPALGRVRNLLKIFYFSALRRYKKVLVIDDLMKHELQKFLKNKTPEICICGLFIDGVRAPLKLAKYPQNRSLGKSDVIHMFFAGHTTRMHQRSDLTEKVKQIQNLNCSCHTVIHVVGNSVETKHYFEQVERGSTELTCRFYDYMPNHELNSLAKSCHFGLVMLCDSYGGYCLPSKLFDNRLNGFSSLYIGPVSQVIKDLSEGMWVFDDRMKVIEPEGPTSCSQLLLRSHVIDCVVDSGCGNLGGE